MFFAHLFDMTVQEFERLKKRCLRALGIFVLTMGVCKLCDASLETVICWIVVSIIAFFLPL